jgi:16S rRNA (cytosine1402-N4)-methyltransferase
MSKKYPPQQPKGESPLHIPVLLKQVISILTPKIGESYLDLTAGYGGHAEAVLEMTDSYKNAVLVDRDSFAISKLQRFKDQGAQVMHDDFASAAEKLAKEGKQFDMVLVDLGVSSPQLDQAERGFSFRADAPLDMRMDQRIEKTAASLINRLSERELIGLISSKGEESMNVAKRYAQSIVRNRPIETTTQLAEIIVAAHRGGWKKIHPATRTFQALRMEVNDELNQIDRMLAVLPALLKPNGRVGVISFHSLEDRLVKKYFTNDFEAGYEAQLAPITKKPISGANEDVHNPRARSAKLRAAVKINRKGYHHYANQSSE